MKILHISTFDYGGAGLSCIRLHRELLNMGIESRILVLDKKFNEPGVFRFEKKKHYFSGLSDTFSRTVKFIFRQFRIPLSRFQFYQYMLQKIRGNYPVIYNLPFSEIDVSRHPLVLWADIIHLQWVAEFIDYPSFFKQITKPVLWTVHDLGLYYGGFHIRREYEKYISEYKKLEERIFKIKTRSISQSKNLSIVSISKQMLEISTRSEIVKNRKHYLINNSVNVQLFRPYDKTVCREIFNLPKNRKILCFTAYYINDENKGLKEILTVLEDKLFNDLMLCVIGTDKNKFEGSRNTIFLGTINDERLLSVAYSACDFLVMPSFQECFSQTPLEAMACGLPVVAFPFSGTDEMITDENGIRTEDFTIEALKKGIFEILKRNYDSKKIRQLVTDKFSTTKIAKQYSDVYRELLNDRDKVLIDNA